MTFGEVIDSPCGVRFMFDKLELQSGFSRLRLFGTRMAVLPEGIKTLYGRLAAFHNAFAGDSHAVDNLRGRLAGLKDIHGTIERLRAGAVLDDIELFEVKTLALLAGEVSAILCAAGIEDPFIPDLTGAAALLDPDASRLPTFHVYDSYSPVLSALRGEIRRSGDLDGRLLAEAVKIEDDIRGELSGTLKPYSHWLREAMEQIADTDILLAKAMQAVSMNLICPEIACDGNTQYKGLFHPPTAERLRAEGKSFQDVDFEFGEGATTIVGANMGGKTVTLKAAGLAQYLFQFGFGIPARNARIGVKDNVTVCIGEEDMSARGLSAFAAEITRIDAILSSARKGGRDLSLIDEPARTTNPEEGAALVKALVGQMAELPTSLIVTTHYDLGGINGLRLRVRGFVNGVMDYALIDAGNGPVPHEALTIAENLGADGAWIASARALLETER